MFNHAMSIAAFGFVAFVLVFMHPGSRASRAAMQQAAAHGGVVTAKVAAADASSRLAASK
jgi:hypothetical protein